MQYKIGTHTLTALFSAVTISSNSIVSLSEALYRVLKCLQVQGNTTTIRN